jgi:hypothetical protein
LRKWYRPEKNSPKDSLDYKILYNQLYIDVKKAIERLIDNISEKAGRKGEELAITISNNILFEQLEKYCETDPEFKTKFSNIANIALKIYENRPPLSDDLIKTLPLL